MACAFSGPQKKYCKATWHLSLSASVNLVRSRMQRLKDGTKVRQASGTTKSNSLSLTGCMCFSCLALQTAVCPHVFPSPIEKGSRRQRRSIFGFSVFCLFEDWCSRHTRSLQTLLWLGQRSTAMAGTRRVHLDHLPIDHQTSTGPQGCGCSYTWVSCYCGCTNIYQASRSCIPVPTIPRLPRCSSYLAPHQLSPLQLPIRLFPETMHALYSYSPPRLL